MSISIVTPETVGRERFLVSPAIGTHIGGAAVYTRPEGGDMLSVHGLSTRSDTTDVQYERFSEDHGRTWSEPREVQTSRPTPDGTFRRYPKLPWVDPEPGLLLRMIMQGVLPTDNPLEGMKHWALRYALSRDGGRSWYHEAPVVHEGAAFTPEHPLPGVMIGKNGFMIGDSTCVPIRTRDGAVLQPIQVMPAGPGGEYHNPGQGYTWTDAAVLIGRWTPGHDAVRWQVSDYVQGDPARTTRGMIEPTLAEMPDGLILMVMRGSNDRDGTMPAYRWYSVSDDGGRTWTEPAPWTYHDGEPFFSPSSCSQLVTHRSGRLFWVGNLCNENARGNGPRYPIVIGQVHPETFGLVESTVTVIDDLRPGDDPRLTLSNFHVREDRETGGLILHMAPHGRGHDAEVARGHEDALDERQRLWTGDAFMYRIRVP